MVVNSFFFKRSKFGQKKQQYNGRTYDSRLEAEGALWLDLMLSQKKIKAIKPQHKISLDINGVHIANHYVDFLVTLNDDRQKFVEIKGFPTNVWLMKRRLCVALYPEIPYLTNPGEKEILA